MFSGSLAVSEIDTLTVIGIARVFLGVDTGHGLNRRWSRTPALLPAA